MEKNKLRIILNNCKHYICESFTLFFFLIYAEKSNSNCIKIIIIFINFYYLYLYRK